MTRVPYRAAVALVAILPGAGTVHAQERYGVVLMHGKWGSPERGIDGLARTLASRGEPYAYARAPHHDRSRYLVVDADHFQTPSVAADAIAAWIETLKR